MTNITDALPDGPFRRAQSADRLHDEAIAGLPREAIQKHLVDRLFDTGG